MIIRVHLWVLWIFATCLASMYHSGLACLIMCPIWIKIYTNSKLLLLYCVQLGSNWTSTNISSVTPQYLDCNITMELVVHSGATCVTHLPTAAAAEVFSDHQQTDQLVSVDVRVPTCQTLNKVVLACTIYSKLNKWSVYLQCYIQCVRFEIMFFVACC